MSLEEEFEKATNDVKSLPKQSNEMLLKLYALFKQAKEGDVSGKRPGMLDVRGRAKYDAWDGLKGTPREEAMQSYVDLVRQLGA